MWRSCLGALCCVYVLLAGPAAEAGDDGQTSLADMLARDPFALPQGELDAWLAYRADASMRDRRPQDWAQIHLRLGAAYFYTAEYALALKALAKAKRAGETSADLPDTFWPEHAAYRALALTDSKRFNEAEVAAGEALSSAGVALSSLDAHSPSRSTALALNAAGYHAYKTSEKKLARDYMCKAAEDARSALMPGDALLHLNANNCGIFLYFLDDPRAADVLEEAALDALAHLASNHPIIGQALNTSYAVLYRFGRYPEAAALARKHMDLEIQLRGANSERVYDPASMLSKALAAQGDLETAAQVQLQVVALAQRMQGAGDFRAKGASQIFYASLLDRLGRLEESAPHYEQGLRALEGAFSKSNENYASAQIGFALHLAQRGQTERALVEAAASLRVLAEALGPSHIDTVMAQLKAALLFARSGQLNDALNLAKAGYSELRLQLLTLTTSRAGLVSTSLQLAQGFSLVAEVALHGEDFSLALEAAQLASASDLSLANADLNARDMTRSAGLSPLVETLQAARMRQASAQRALDANLRGDSGATALADLAEALAAAKAQTSGIEIDIEARFPAFAQLRVPAPIDARDIMRSLGPDRAIIMPLYSVDRVFTLVITGSGVQWHASAMAPYAFDARRASILSSISKARQSPHIRLENFDAVAAHALFEAVISANLYRTLEDVKTLFFVSSGPLAYLPPSILVTQPPGGGDIAWLIRDKAVSVISGFGGLDQLDAPLRKTQFIGLGDPLLSGPINQTVDVAQLFRGGDIDAASLRALPQLPNARRELKKMRKALGRKTSMLVTRGDFTQQSIAALDFSDASVVAFATHGLTSEAMIGLGEPALVLSPLEDGRSDNAGDGLLTASEISSMSIPADWVILSACNSGAGRSAAAPMYSGLARAFRTAGAKALLLSHWPVRDDAAARLSIAAVKNNRRGMGKAEALRQAQLSLMAARDVPGAGHPAVWAPFVLIAN